MKREEKYKICDKLDYHIDWIEYYIGELEHKKLLLPTIYTKNLRRKQWKEFIENLHYLKSFTDGLKIHINKSLKLIDELFLKKGGKNG